MIKSVIKSVIQYILGDLSWIIITNGGIRDNNVRWALKQSFLFSCFLAYSATSLLLSLS